MEKKKGLCGVAGAVTWFVCVRIEEAVEAAATASASKQIDVETFRRRGSSSGLVIAIQFVYPMFP